MRQASVVRLRAFSPWGSGTRHISAGLENDRIIPSLGEGGQPAGGITEGGIQIHDPAQPLYGTGLVPDLLQEQPPGGRGKGRRASTLRLATAAVHADAARWYEALVGVGRETDASALADMLVGLQPSAQAYLALIAAAKAAGRLDLGRDLTEKGLGALPEGPQRQELRRVSRLLLREDG